MQVEVTWTVPAAAAPRAGPARRHRDGHARRGRGGRRAAPACGVVSGYVRYLNWFLFWSRCETGMSAIHAFCDFTRRSQKKVDESLRGSGRAAPGDIIDNTRNSSVLRVGSTGSETRGRTLDSRYSTVLRRILLPQGASAEWSALL